MFFLIFITKTVMLMEIDFMNVSISTGNLMSLRPILKSCSFPIHRPDEIKNSHEPPAGRNFFFAISLSKI